MKKSILIGLVIASTSAFAVATPSQQGFMTFTSEKSPSCTLDVTKNEALLAFTQRDLTSDEHYTKAIVKSDVSTTAVVDIRANWVDTSAWGGNEPEVEFHTGMNYGNGDGFVGLNGQVKYTINAKNEENVLEVAAQVSEMTHAGTGRLDTVVQVSCE
ncbi:MAG: hypothetical protein ACRC9Y_11170 [Aeromonas veronii]